MSKNESILEEMLDRVTNPVNDTADEMGVEIFCIVVRKDVQLIKKALELIWTKIRGVNVMEAIRAIALLEECMTQCGSDFRKEVARYRFLNGFIRMVSDKFEGAETPVAIKKRLIECLLLWTTEFPEEKKIRETYDSLKKHENGMEQVDAPPLAEAKCNATTLGIDEQKLHELLHSGDPENLKRANELIQKGVHQEARRTELALKHKSDLDVVQTIITLLNQMLDSYESEGNKTNEDNLNLIRELYLSCKKHKSMVIELLENIENELLSDTLETSEMLQAVLKRYKQTIVHPAKSETNENIANISSTTLLTELLSELPVTNGLGTTVTTMSAKTNPLDELTEIFGNSVPTQAAAETSPVELLGSFDLLNDVPILTTTPNAASAAQASTYEPSSEKRPFRDLPEIDKLSEKLFQMSLPTAERINSFKKDPDKLTLNDLAKERMVDLKPIQKNAFPQNSKTETPSAVIAAEQLVIENQSSVDDKDVSILSNVHEAIFETTVECVTATEASILTSTVTPSNELPFKHLSDIEVSLDDIVPTAEERLLLDDGDVNVTLNFTENRPSRHVSVVVISVLNKSKMPIKDFQFEASAKKPSKVRLLPPTAFSMSPFKPFRPPMPINQIMLILNPTGKAIDITCIVGYKSGDDPDPIKDSLVARDIPYVD